MKKAIQTSESIELGILLALGGGLMDAYSYIERGKVFANAQTGNLLLLGIHISEGEFWMAAKYLFPVLAFTCGIALADVIHMKRMKRLHWRQVCVLVEIAILGVVGVIPLSLNLLANSLTSLACGIQVESFRKIHGHGIATTMCIGNLRSATQNICSYFQTGETHHIKKGGLYLGVILCFIAGAVSGNFLIPYLRIKTIWIAGVFLGAAFVIMFIDREKDAAAERQTKK